MKKILFLSFITICICPSVFAEGALNISVPDAVNSRIFSTQGTRPLDNLERTHYTNNALMQLENKQKIKNENENKDTQVVPVREKTTIKNLFKGFRVIW